MEPKLSYLPERKGKPRDEAISVITDYGLGIAEIENIVSTSGSLIDMVKISVSALCSDIEVKERLRIYKNSDILVTLSGTLFEASYLRNSLEDYYSFIYKSEFDSIEISSGIINIQTGEKGEIIDRLSNDFRVISELGNKQNKSNASSEIWKTDLKSDKEAGAWKILLEGGEDGKSYIFNDDGQPWESRINSIASIAKMEDLIWEAPFRHQQDWFVQKFGLGVNLANIEPGDLTRLESLRIGLHSETFSKGLPEELIKGRIKGVNPMYNLDIQI